MKHGKNTELLFGHFTNSAIGDYWLVDMLDQNGIDKNFYYMHELELFFHACGLNMKSA